MASLAKQITLFFLLLTISSSSLHITHARDSQFFNKVPSTSNDNNVLPNNNKDLPYSNNNEEQQQQQQQQDPAFLPDTENGYGLYGELPPSARTTTDLYGHETGQLPPATTTPRPGLVGHETGQLPPSTPDTEESTTSIPNTESKRPLSKYLPKNYNPVAYVTQPEDFNDNSNSFTEAKSFSTTSNPYSNNYYNNGGKSYNNNNVNNNNLPEEEPEQEEETYQYNNNNYAGGSSFNSQPQGMSDTRYTNGASLSSRDRFNYGGEASNNAFQPQGMSDTRFLENGKYFYDLNTEKYSNNHPYESLRGNARARNDFGNRNYYGNRENAYEFNNENSINGGGYGNQAEFQNEENYNMP